MTTEEIANVDSIIETRQEFDNQGARFLEQSRSFKVTDADTYERSIALIKSGKSFVRKVENFMNPHIDRANKAHKALTSDRSRLLSPVKEAMRLYAGLGETYMAEMRRKQAQEQARIDAEARAAEEEARKQEEDRILEQATEAEEHGDKMLAEKLVEKPIIYKPPSPQPKPAQVIPKVAGVHYRKRWRAELVEPGKVESTLLLNNKVKDALEAVAQDIAERSNGKISVPGFKITDYQQQITRR